MTERLALTAERAPFVMLPRWLLYHRRVGEGAKFLYCVLHDLVAGREGPTRPVTRAELADRCGVSANTIDRRLAELVGAGAVDKEPQILAGGQVGNVYRVWLSPPDQRPTTRLPGSPETRSEGITNGGDPPRNPVDNHLPTNGEARSERVLSGGEPPQHWGASLPAGEDPTVVEEQNQEGPPQPPRPAGGPGEFETDTAATAARRSPRAARTNPRAEADRAEAERLEKEAARRQAELELTTQARRAADRAAQAEAERLEAEALSISAAVDDDTLCAVVAQVTAGLSGLLAGSTVAVSRAVIAWCRTAAATYGGPFTAAVAGGLADGLTVREGSAPLDLVAAPAATASLRTRVAGILKAGAVI